LTAQQGLSWSACTEVGLQKNTVRIAHVGILCSTILYAQPIQKATTANFITLFFHPAKITSSDIFYN
jgi:hypothetical protein